jgi:hypothetical protein
MAGAVSSAPGVGDRRGGISRTRRIGQTGVDEALGVTEIRRQENVEWRAVLDLCSEGGRGLESGFSANTGGLAKLLQNRREHGPQVGSRSYAQRGLGHDRGEAHQSEQCNGNSVRHHTIRTSEASKNLPTLVG